MPVPDPQPAELRAALDRLAIDELHSRYTLALNWQDADAVANTFAPDGVLDWAGGMIEGREAIRAEVHTMRAFFAKAEAADAPLRAAHLRHFITNKIIDVDGDAARTIGYWFELNNDNRLRWPYVGAYGHYEDTLVRLPEGWRFLRRTIFNEQMAERTAAERMPQY